MSVKLVAFDMDGTVLTSDKRLPVGLFDEMRRLRAAGISCAAATGRFSGTVGEMFAPVADIMSYVACNGHEIVRDGRSLARSVFQPATVLALGGLGRACGGMVPVFFTPSRGFALARPETWHPIAASEYGPTDLLDEPDLSEDVIKVSFFKPEGIEACLGPLEAHAGELAQDVGFVQTSPWTIDCCLDGMNKARGLSVLARDMGIGMDEVMAIGDHMNDYEMVVESGCGVAVRNAIDELKAVADRVSPYTNDEYAVLREMQAL